MMPIQAEVQLSTYLETKKKNVAACFDSHLVFIVYIHNCSLQPFSQDYNLVSHTTNVLCVNFMYDWRNIQ